MGWMWSDAPKETPTDTAASHSLSRQHATPPPSSSSPPPPPPLPTPDPARALTRDELAEAELEAILHGHDPAPPPSPSTTTSQPASSPFPLSERFPSSPPSLVNHSATLPRDILPTTMSCRAAFDAAFYCQSLGGQFTNLYRYGGMRSCSEQWGHFWFCMRTNRGVLSEEGRKRAIQEHYRARARKYVEGASSEDVWEVRGERVEGAFEGDLEAVEREMREGEGGGEAEVGDGGMGR
ncbi:hypothetical protein MMC13_003664 [Lambiella insularis]|nr:hypothetical protein [Lambiella insularis]